jgi:hypothetical protein
LGHDVGAFTVHSAGRNASMFAPASTGDNEGPAVPSSHPATAQQAATATMTVRMQWTLSPERAHAMRHIAAASAGWCGVLPRGIMSHSLLAPTVASIVSIKEIDA